MRRYSLLPLVPFALLCSLSTAQRSTVPAKPLDQFTGLPENPTFFSAMTAIWQGYLQYEDTLDMKGPVASVEREEIQSPNQDPDSHHITTTLKFDDQGHLIKLIRIDSTEISTITRTFRDGKLQCQTVEHHFVTGQRPDSQERLRWSYADHGRLSDFQTEEEHYFNFKYDAEGRLLGYDSNGQDSAKISYAGNTTTISTLDENHQKSYEEVKILDDKKRVVDMSVAEFTAGSLPVNESPGTTSPSGTMRKAGCSSRKQRHSIGEKAMITRPCRESWWSSTTIRNIRANRNSMIPMAS